MLDLLEGVGGVLALVEEECRMQRGTDANFLGKLKQFSAPKVEVHLHQPGAPPADTLTFPRLQNDLFTVRHYAGEVTYTARGFRDKSIDSVHQGSISLVCSSTDPFIANLFLNDPTAFVDQPTEGVATTPSRSLFGGKSTPSTGTPSKSNRRTLSVGMQFKTQLGGLVEEINSTQSHYVRCIKPNDTGKPNTWLASSVLGQLRCQGILEAIRIARAMYPNRMKHTDFISTYSICLRDAGGGGIGNASELWSEAHVERLLLPLMEEPEPAPMNAFDVFAAIEEVGSDEDEPAVEPSPSPEPAKKSGGFGFGGIFSGGKKAKDKEKEKEARERQLENEREAAVAAHGSARRLIELLDAFDEEQAVLGHTKVFLRAEAFDVLESKRQRVQALFALRLQAAARGFLARCLCRRLRAATTILQTACRRGVARKRYLSTRHAAIRLQAFRRGAQGRKALRELHMNRASTMIAANARAWRARAQYKSLQRASVTVQKSARCKLAQLRYVRLRDEARDSARLEGRLATVENEFATLTEENVRLQQEVLDAASKARAELSIEWESEVEKSQSVAREAQESTVAVEEQLRTIKSELELERETMRAQSEQFEAEAEAQSKQRMAVVDEAARARRALVAMQDEVEQQAAERAAEIAAVRQHAEEAEVALKKEAEDAAARLAATEQAQALKEEALKEAAAATARELETARQNLGSAEMSTSEEVASLREQLESNSVVAEELAAARKADQAKFMQVVKTSEEKYAESEAQAVAVAEAKLESASKAAEVERIAIASELTASEEKLQEAQDLHSAQQQATEDAFAKQREELERALQTAQDEAEAALEQQQEQLNQSIQQSTEDREEEHEELNKTTTELRAAEAALEEEKATVQAASESHSEGVAKLQGEIMALREEATVRQEQYAARQEERERVDVERAGAEETLRKDNTNLSEQLEALQANLAGKDEGVTEMVEQIQAKLRQTKEERGGLAQQLAQEQAESAALRSAADATAAAAAKNLASSVAAEREALAVTHEQAMDLIKLEAEADAEDLQDQLEKANAEVESMSKQIEDWASVAEETDQAHEQELADVESRAEEAEALVKELQAVAQMEEGAASEQEAAAQQKQEELEAEMHQLREANAALEQKTLGAEQREAEDHAMLSASLDKALAAVRRQAEETEAAAALHVADKEQALAAAAEAHTAAVEQVRVEADEAHAAELSEAVIAAKQDASRALRTQAEAETTAGLEATVAQLTRELEEERTAAAEAEAARDAETFMLEAQGEAREAATIQAAEEAEQMSTALHTAQDEAMTAHTVAKVAELAAAEAVRSLANAEEERNAVLKSLNELSNARKAEVATAAEELKRLREALAASEERAASVPEPLLPPPSPGPPPDVVQTVKDLEKDVAAAEAKAAESMSELKELRGEKRTRSEKVKGLEAQVMRLTEHLRCSRAAVEASEEADEELKERQMKVKYMKENQELAKTAREATERATRLEGVVRKYRAAAEDAAQQLRTQADTDDGRIEMRQELRQSPAAKRPSSIPRVSRLVQQRVRLQREAEDAAEVIARGHEARQHHWSSLAKPVRPVSPTTPMREHSPTERNQSASPSHKPKQSSSGKKPKGKQPKNAARVPREKRWDYAGTPAPSAKKKNKRGTKTSGKKEPSISADEQQAVLAARIAELEVELGIADSDPDAQQIGGGLVPGTPPRTPSQIGGEDKEHSPRFVALRRSLSKQVESSGQKPDNPASHVEAVEAANQLRQAIASGDPAGVAASAAAIRRSSSSIIERATSTPPPVPAEAKGGGKPTATAKKEELSKVERTLLAAELEVAKGELLSLLAAPGNTYKRATGRAQPPPRRTLATGDDPEPEPAEAESSDDDDSGDDANDEEEEPLFENGGEQDDDDDDGEDDDADDDSSDSDEDNHDDKENDEDEDDDEEKHYEEDESGDEDDDDKKDFFERYAEDNARRRWHRQRLTVAKAEEEEAGGRWKAKSVRKDRSDSDQTWKKVREAQQLKRAYLEERRRRAEEADLEMCRKAPLTKKSRELADKVAAKRGSFFEREAQFSAERARKLERSRREKEEVDYQRRPTHREIGKAESEGFVARQLAWESKVEAKRAVKKEIMEEAVLAGLRERYDSTNPVALSALVGLVGLSV